MNKLRCKSVFRKLIAICLALFLVGCAVLPGNELPRIDGAGSGKVEKPVPVLFSFQWGTEKIDAYTNPQEYELSRKQHAVASRTVSTSRRFAGATKSSSPSSTYTLNYLVQRHDPPLLAAMGSVLSDLTLTLIPGVETRRWTLTAELFDPEGTSIWRREYIDSVKFIYWMPLFPVTIFQGNKFATADDDVLTNLYRQPIADLDQSDLFKKKRTNLFRQITAPK